MGSRLSFSPFCPRSSKGRGKEGGIGGEGRKGLASQQLLRENTEKRRRKKTKGECFPSNFYLTEGGAKKGRLLYDLSILLRKRGRKGRKKEKDEAYSCPLVAQKRGGEGGKNRTSRERKRRGGGKKTVSRFFYFLPVL